MKKLVSVLLVVAMAATLLVGSAFAAGTAVTIGSATAKAGKEVTIDVVISGNTGFDTSDLEFTYDHDAMTLTTITKGLFKGSVYASTAKANHFGAEAVTANGTLVSLTFKVKEGAGAKGYAVGFASGCYLALDDDELTDVTFVAGTITVEAAPHTHTWEKWQDCKDGENHIRYCKDYETCKGSETLAHNWDEGKETKPATHTEEGVKTYTCKDCGATKTEPITKLEGHTYGDWKKFDGNQHVKECACGDKVYENHNWDEGKETKPATHTEEGVKTYTCEDCGATKTEPIAKLEGHTYGDWKKFDDNQHVKECACGDKVYENHNWDEGKETKPATETEEGEMTYTCEDCGATYANSIEPTEPEPKPTEKPADPSATAKPSDKPTSDKSHKTGEDFIALWTILFVVAGAAVVVVTHKKKEN